MIIKVRKGSRDLYSQPEFRLRGRWRKPAPTAVGMLRSQAPGQNPGFTDTAKHPMQVASAPRPLKRSRKPPGAEQAGAEQADEAVGVNDAPSADEAEKVADEAEKVAAVVAEQEGAEQADEAVGVNDAPSAVEAEKVADEAEKVAAVGAGDATPAAKKKRKKSSRLKLDKTERKRPDAKPEEEQQKAGSPTTSIAGKQPKRRRESSEDGDGDEDERRGKSSKKADKIIVAGSAKQADDKAPAVDEDKAERKRRRKAAARIAKEAAARIAKEAAAADAIAIAPPEGKKKKKKKKKKKGKESDGNPSTMMEGSGGASSVPQSDQTSARHQEDFGSYQRAKWAELSQLDPDKAVQGSIFGPSAIRRKPQPSSWDERTMGPWIDACDELEQENVNRRAQGEAPFINGPFFEEAADRPCLPIWKPKWEPNRFFGVDEGNVVATWLPIFCRNDAAFSPEANLRIEASRQDWNAKDTSYTEMIGKLHDLGFSVDIAENHKIDVQKGRFKNKGLWQTAVRARYVSGLSYSWALPGLTVRVITARCEEAGGKCREELHRPVSAFAEKEAGGEYRRIDRIIVQRHSLWWSAAQASVKARTMKPDEQHVYVYGYGPMVAAYDRTTRNFGTPRYLGDGSRWRDCHSAATSLYLRWVYQ